MKKPKEKVSSSTNEVNTITKNKIEQAEKSGFTHDTKALILKKTKLPSNR